MHSVHQKNLPCTCVRISAQRWLERGRRLRSSAVNYYDVLGVDAEADAQQIKTAFRQKAKQLHPDVNRAPGMPFPLNVTHYPAIYCRSIVMQLQGTAADSSASNVQAAVLLTGVVLACRC